MSTNDVLARPGPALKAGGETLYRWARENEMRAAALAAYAIAVVIMLALVVPPVVDVESPSPSPRAVAVPDYYTLRKNDTLAAIAARYGLTVEEVRALNPGLDPMALEPGSELRLSESAPPVAAQDGESQKKKKSPAKESSTAAKSAPKASAPAQPPPAPEVSTMHVVSTGDTLTSIAARYGTTVSDLLAANPGIDPYSLVAGQEISVP